MTKLRKCPNNHYTLEEICPQCNQKTKDAHYKFIKTKNQDKGNVIKTN